MFSPQIIEKRKKLEADGLVKLPLCYWLSSRQCGCPSPRLQGAKTFLLPLGNGSGRRGENIQPLQCAMRGTSPLGLGWGQSRHRK